MDNSNIDNVKKYLELKEIEESYFKIKQFVDFLADEILDFLKSEMKKQATNVPNITCYNQDKRLPKVFETYPKEYESKELMVLKVYFKLTSKIIAICIGYYDIEEQQWYAQGFCLAEKWVLDDTIYEIVEISPLPFGFQLSC